MKGQGRKKTLPFFVRRQYVLAKEAVERDKVHAIRCPTFAFTILTGTWYKVPA
jgi:hypothetical protein